MKSGTGKLKMKHIKKNFFLCFYWIYWEIQLEEAPRFVLLMITPKITKNQIKYLPLPPLRSREPIEEIPDPEGLGVQAKRRREVKLGPEGAGQRGEPTIGVHVDDSSRNNRIHGALRRRRSAIGFGLEDGFLVRSRGSWVFVFWREGLAVFRGSGRFGPYWVSGVVVGAGPWPRVRERVLAVEEVAGMRGKYMIIKIVETEVLFWFG